MISLAVLVFVLALRAKLSLYETPSPASLNPVAASKLWVSGEKLEKLAISPIPVLWLATLVLLRPPVRQIARTRIDWAPAPQHLSMLQPNQFLRPPPSF